MVLESLYTATFCYISSGLSLLHGISFVMFLITLMVFLEGVDPQEMRSKCAILIYTITKVIDFNMLKSSVTLIRLTQQSCNPKHVYSEVGAIE